MISTSHRSQPTALFLTTRPTWRAAGTWWMACWWSSLWSTLSSLSSLLSAPEYLEYWGSFDFFGLLSRLGQLVIYASLQLSKLQWTSIKYWFWLKNTFFPRMISRAPGLKLVVSTLLSSLRPIGNIVLICCTFFIIFGILGVQVSLCNNILVKVFIVSLLCVTVHWVSIILQLFKGTFYHCEGPYLKNIRNKTDCINRGHPYKWTNRKYNFDDLGQVVTKNWKTTF